MSVPHPIPTEIKLHKVSRMLELTFSDGEVFKLPAEFLRVYSPSAEVRGHGPGQEVLQLGKQNVEISNVEPVGSYAVKLVFSDGHDTGLYSWDYLHEIGREQDKLWKQYLKRLKEAGIQREPEAMPVSGTKWKSI
ncbi:MAG: gamma-butyrobetaine hydroxylase-like domain-containing protein [Burkholderiales bacterium]